MKPIVLTGAGGLLGGAFRRLLAEQPLICLAREQLDVEQPDALRAALAAAQPGLIIHCAAHTDLEAAERDSTVDIRANSRLPGLIAELAREHDALLVHFSSTGCYGDWKTSAYVEDDPLAPTTAHHRAKADGERAITEVGGRHLILRTGWLYGGLPGQPKNFVWNRLVEARGKTEMQSDASQRGCPTYVMDVAAQTLSLVKADQAGTFNLTAHGAASRFDYVAAIVAAAGLACLVKPGPAFKRLAKVSPNETAINSRLLAEGLDQMPEWRESLINYVGTLLRSPAWAQLGAAEGVSR